MMMRHFPGSANKIVNQGCDKVWMIHHFHKLSLRLSEHSDNPSTLKSGAWIPDIEMY